MKNIIIAMFLLLSIITQSQSIKIKEAKLVGKNYFFQKLNRFEKINYDKINISSCEAYKDNNDNTLYYVINFADKGFVLVSANKNIIPVLAYSDTKKFEGEIPPAVNSWLNKYKSQIKYINDRNIKNTENNKEWEALLKMDKNINKDINIYIEPLVHSEWDQGFYYNAACPEASGGPDNRCLTGCVATATGQLLYYHRFPKTGTGSHTYDCPNIGIISEDFSTANYDYNEMPYKITNYSYSAALLLYHLGVSFDMNYGPDGSGVWNHSVDNSLKTYFKYCSETEYVFRDSTSLNWDSIVVTNLLANKPLYYAGWEDLTFQSGHAFVCDGYDGPNYYHFNWGWGGSYDGWYYSDNITPGGSQFTYAQEIIKDIYPDTINYTYYPETCSGNTNINYSTGSLSDGSGIKNYEPNSDCTWLLNPDCGKFVDVYFDEFYLEDNDTLYVYEGNETENMLLDFYTKGKEPILSWMSNSDVLSTTEGELIIKFTSDNSVEGMGWKVSYFANHCKFGDTHTDTAGTISDGSEICNYEPNTSCMWIIEPDNAEAIKINFTEFKLDTNNIYDNIRIFKDVANTSNQIAKFTSIDLPSEIIVPSGVAIITFSTSSTSSAEGWSFDYSVTTLDKIDEIETDIFKIYPNPTKGIINIESSSKNINKIQISDITGKIILSKNYNSKNIILDLSYLDKGIYFIKISNKTNKIIIE